MPNKRDVLEALKRDELQEAADRFHVSVRDRRVRDDLIDALASSRKAGLAGILEGLARYRLKEVCRGLNLDDSGREKALLINRLTGRDGHAVSPPEPARAVATVEKKTPSPAPPRGGAQGRAPARTEARTEGGMLRGRFRQPVVGDPEHRLGQPAPEGLVVPRTDTDSMRGRKKWE